MKITIRLAHPPGSKLHPPTPSPKMGEGEPDRLKVPLPTWERDLAIILIVNPLWLAWPSEWVLYR